jgi:hypothetical protein
MGGSQGTQENVGREPESTYHFGNYYQTFI